MEFINKINSLLDNLADKEAFSGTVLLQKGKDVLISRSFGYANRGWRIKNTANTRFRVASITKIFTAFSILELIDEGQFCLETSAVKY
jgi:CubicO group peptidase (beta-lactamase class C family)